jgi:solute carrier family 10 (sodium/bile acid cotransporter), member 7
VKPLLSFLHYQWFIIALILCVSIGWWQSTWFEPIAENKPLRSVLVASVMFFMALPIPLGQIKKSLFSPFPVLLAVFLNIGIMPVAAALIASQLDKSFAGGLIVAACVPCTLASAAVWTRRGGGDETVPILVTLITNGTCFITAPLWLQLLLGRTTKLPLTEMIVDLLLTVLVPIVAAQVLNSRKSIHAWASRKKHSLSLFCQIGILAMVLIGGTQIGLRWNHAGSIAGLTGMIVQIFVLAVAFHLAMVWLGWTLAKLFYFDREKTVAVSIAGSQKTLMVGLQLSIDCGVSILPMVAYHVMQLIADSYLVQWWNTNQNSTKQSPTVDAEDDVDN